MEKASSLPSYSLTETLALWVHKQMDDIERASKLLELAFEICNMTPFNQFVETEAIEVFLEDMQNINFIENFHVDSNITQAMSMTSSDDTHNILVQSSIEILDHIENLTFLLFDHFEYSFKWN